MKLKSLKIKGFKNLSSEDGWFTLDFTDKNGITVLIGNNGSGKSNIIEAISSIFTGLYKMGTPQRKPTFEYVLEYILNDTDKYKLSLTTSPNGDKIYNFTKNENNIAVGTFKANPSQYLPSSIVAIYSGEEMRLWESYYKHLYNDFMREVKGNFQILSNPKLVYINKYYWDISLLSLLYSELQSNQTFCQRILKTDNLNDIKIIIKFNTNNLTNFSENSVVSFVKSLNTSEEREKEISLNELRENQLIGSEKDLFLKLMASVMDKESKYKLIEDITIKYSNDLTTESLSEGEKKQILIRTGLEIVADTDSLILLDEPDSHIHVANKSLLKDILSEYETKDTVLTTHSPTLMNIFSEHLVFLENGTIKGEEKAEILKEISGDSMSLAEQQIVLNSTNDILLVEGKLDIIFIQEALKRLDEYNVLQDMIFIPTGGASGLRLFIDKFTAKDNQNIIAILDNDKAGKDEVKEILTDNNYRTTLDRDGYVQINELKNTYLLLLPKPENVTNSQYEIEDYFPLSKLIEISKTQIDTFRVLKDFIIKKDFVKKKLSEECKNENYIQEDFIEFKKLFDLIKTIKGS